MVVILWIKLILFNKHNYLSISYQYLIYNFLVGEICYFKLKENTELIFV